MIPGWSGAVDIFGDRMSVEDLNDFLNWGREVAPSEIEQIRINSLWSDERLVLAVETTGMRVPYEIDPILRPETPIWRVRVENLRPIAPLHETFTQRHSLVWAVAALRARWKQHRRLGHLIVRGRDGHIIEERRYGKEAKR